MAKVKIQGHASGTGVLTVTAPNTSTDRTITLPDGTGSLIADNGSGQVGIGTTTHYDNSTKLTVSGRINTTNGTATGSMNYGGGAVVNMGALTNHPVNLMVNNSTKWVIDTNGNLIAEGGGGIVLGNTSYAAANELDDYEEGTWTPTVATGTISAASEARYTKVGKLCNVTCILKDFSDKSTNAQIQIRGLPFTQGHTFTVGTVIAYQNGNSNPMGLITGATTSEFKIFYLHSASSWGTQNHNTLGGDPHFYLSGVYQTT